jgi:hypothetical protein
MPQAAVNLAYLRNDLGDATGAREAYQWAIDSGHPEHAPKATYGLAHQLEEDGDTAARSRRIAGSSRWATPSMRRAHR